MLALVLITLFVLTPTLSADSASSLNCSIYKSDKEIILSLPFLVYINPVQPREITYAIVNRWGNLTELHVFGQEFIPLSIFCFTGLSSLSVINSTFYIPTEITRLASTLVTLRISNISTSQIPLPAELFMLNKLTTLHLTHYGIEILSDDITKLSRLVTLDLHGNRLSGSLPDSINQLRYLNKLDISNNPLITSLEVLNESSSLSELWASHCGLIYFPLHLSRLRTLDLSHNQLTSLVGIETMFPNHPSKSNYESSLRFSLDYYQHSLSNLDLSNNKIWTIPEELYHFYNLQKLNLKNNQFSNQEIEWIVGRFRRVHSMPNLII